MAESGGWAGVGEGLRSCVRQFLHPPGTPRVNSAHKTPRKYFFFYQSDSNSAHRPGPLGLLHIIKN